MSRPTVQRFRVRSAVLASSAALEVGRISLATSEDLADAFADLSEARRRREELPALAVGPDQTTTKDGRTIGLGTDVGPMAICDRQDLLKAAGLPSDPEGVGRLWAGDRAKFVETGQRYRAEAPEGTGRR